MDPKDRFDRLAEEVRRRVSVADMSASGTKRFAIGEMFPADDPVARFMTVLAMVANDWTSVSALVLNEDLPAEQRLYLVRQQLVLLHEAVKFISESRKRFPDIDAFLRGLDSMAQTLLKRIIEMDDSSSPEHLPWKTPLRNLTAHYPEMHPKKYEGGQDEIANALQEAASTQSTVTWDNTKPLGLRYGFAYEVLSWTLPPPEDLFAGTLTGTHDVFELITLAFDAYWRRNDPPQKP